ncbi:hypothetical protein SD70_14640 [Gordoniibacillus kamchatkensis]|uniref:SPOR domain-containing protein n=1 Tax=Gordoniibacillus kamchatkensis TaxID=1590651 RepID=A0ABR5AH00_9BACL|nr:SPOR domain-containing protein [Paenibacillus sp. VKM B-2647]KIL40316.1 hypothetical protein SD70_14640 [Paenibacillus sp. VKM B-2647]
MLNEYTRDFGTYRSPFDEETERVERMIRESGRVNGETGYVESVPRKYAPPAEPIEPLSEANAHAAVHDEQYREPFASGYEGYRHEHRDEAGPSYDWGEPQIGIRYAKSSETPPWTRIVLSVTGAVVTGVLFGFLVLSMFTDSPLPLGIFGNGKSKQASASAGGNAAASGSKTGSAAAGSDKTAQGSAAGTGAAQAAGGGVSGAQTGQAAPAVSGSAADAGAAAGSLVAVQLPGRSYAFLQHGIFSSEQAAQAAQDELRKKGYAAASVAEPGDKTTVYAGFALRKEDAVQLSRKLQGDKLDVFVKAVNVPAATKLKWTGKASAGELSAYFQQGDKLAQMIGSLTVLHLGETKPSAIEADTLEAIKATHQSWIAASTPVKAGAADTAAPSLQQMTT